MFLKTILSREVTYPKEPFRTDWIGYIKIYSMLSKCFCLNHIWISHMEDRSVRSIRENKTVKPESLFSWRKDGTWHIIKERCLQEMYPVYWVNIATGWEWAYFIVILI